MQVPGPSPSVGAGAEQVTGTAGAVHPVGAVLPGTKYTLIVVAGLMVAEPRLHTGKVVVLP